MADELNFTTEAGLTIDRELLVAYLNTGTSESPTWAPLGMRVTDSSMEYDMSKETVQDILGATRTTMKKPVITQSFDPLPLDASDAAAKLIWNTGIREQNVQKLANMDVLVAHMYAGTTDALFAERYPASAIEITSLGGDGGAHLTMGTSITYGGTRATGTVKKATDGTVTFTAAA